MSIFVTNDILAEWTGGLQHAFDQQGCRVVREFSYINKPLPFRALHMGKKNDEYFLDESGNKIKNKDLLADLDQLVIRDFDSLEDLSLPDKQAKKARSDADIYLCDDRIQIVIELEVFKDKPFSNLIYVPEVCKPPVEMPLHFLHCFAPERHDREADLTRAIGHWLMKQNGLMGFHYQDMFLPEAPDSLRYLLPPKQKPKSKSYQIDGDRQRLRTYAADFCHGTLIPIVEGILAEPARP